MDKFRNIKTVASYFNLCNGREYAAQSGCRVNLDSRDDLNISPENCKKLGIAARDRGFGAYPLGGMVILRSAGAVEKRSHFDFKFYKDAPYLYRFINHLEKSFNIALDNNNKLSVAYNYQANFMGLIKTAHYFIGGNKTCYINLDSPTPMVISSINPTRGICHRQELFVGLSIEFPLSWGTVIHELIHLKWPAASAEEDVDELTGQVMKNLKPMLASMNLRELEKLTKKHKQEYDRISKDFGSYDEHLGQILAIQ